MQPIQRAAYPDRLSSPAANLAALIHEQASNSALSPTEEQERGAATDAMKASGPAKLIWVESAAAPASLSTGAARGVIVAAHGPSESSAKHSFIISYPVESGSPVPRLPAVLRRLRAMGWSLLARQRRAAAGACAHTAFLVNTARPGPEQRLWLSEPMSPVQPGALSDGKAAAVPPRTSDNSAVLHETRLELRRRTKAMATEQRVSFVAGE